MYDYTLNSSQLGIKLPRYLYIHLYCKISLTLPFDLCLYMGFLIAWRIVYSRALHGEL